MGIVINYQDYGSQGAQNAQPNVVNNQVQSNEPGNAVQPQQAAPQESSGLDFGGIFNSITNALGMNDLGKGLMDGIKGLFGGGNSEGTGSIEGLGESEGAAATAGEGAEGAGLIGELGGGLGELGELALLA